MARGLGHLFLNAQARRLCHQSFLSGEGGAAGPASPALLHGLGGGVGEGRDEIPGPPPH